MARNPALVNVFLLLGEKITKPELKLISNE